ncbi:MAG TPA: adenosylcobinamide-phosphate synthase CbiB [Pyrinomonadaceae bacterium]|jgi:adenosylcobinamide-phosphate synthase|nr:adenosylcobinamide-phosphate synthase CbiB [Pyrinomonadaceae bacterium]
MISPASFALAYALDWLIGDPAWLPHPVRWMGWMIKGGEALLRRFSRAPSSEFIAGTVLTVIVVSTFGVGSWILLRWLGAWNPKLAFAISIYLAASTLATRSLLDEARAVRRFLVNGDLLSARQQVAHIVGRDPQELDEPEVTRAVIETLAESASDGIVAPMFYLAIGGVPAALAYKAINTLDSMIGHRNKHYQYFGKCAARLDDVASFIPARVSALLFVSAAWTLRLDWRGAWRIMWRDGAKHKSPNAGRPEAAVAGALGVQVGGTNFYEGERHDGQYLGDVHNPLDDEALRNALLLTGCVSLLMFALCLSLRLLVRW